MLGADITKTRDEKEFVAAAGHQGHGGSADRIFQIMAAEKISFAEATKRPRNMVIARPAPSPTTCRRSSSRRGDGFVLMPNLFPTMFEEFGRMVVPELQRRGLFRTEYAGGPCARI